MVNYNRFDAGEIISHLSGQNCTYLFTYIFMYYAIYRFQFEWDFFNIKMLRALWNHPGNMQEDAEVVTEKIKNSNIGHRFEQKMYLKFIEECL